MYIAQKLRKTSIAEYLLYMWQIEDLIRAYGCSIGRIKREYISKFTNLTDEQKEDELDWFDNLIRMMNEEGKREKGHLNINAIIIQDLTDLSQQLLDSNRFPFYNAEYYKVLPFIGTPTQGQRRSGRDRDLFQCALRQDAPADEAEGNLTGDGTCLG